MWRRFRRDRTALASLIAVVLILLGVFAGAPLLTRALGHGAEDPFPLAVDAGLKPVGIWSRVPNTNAYTDTPPKETTLFVLGGDGPLGRDLFLRVVDGGIASLEVAILATFVAMVIGLALGGAAGYFGGWIDAVVSRLTDFAMAFPFILLVIVLGTRGNEALDEFTAGGLLRPGVATLVLLIGGFTWYYPARVIRARVRALREREFLEAARMTGAGDWHILRAHVFPHLVPVLLVYGSLLIAVNILLEAGVSFLGVGIESGTPSWGNILAYEWGALVGGNPALTGPVPARVTVAPSIAIFATVVAFNLLGEGLRAAADPERTG